MKRNIEQADDQQDQPTSNDEISTPSKMPQSSDIMQQGNYVILKTVSGLKRINKLQSFKCSLSKVGDFEMDKLIGLPYGVSFELMPSGELRVMSRAELNQSHYYDADEFDETNQDIYDEASNQKLSLEEIERLKEEAQSSAQVIETIAQNNVSFNKKTEYSKQKYIKRKKAKFQRSFTTIKPTLRSLSELYMEKNPTKISELRFDTLTMMMNMANICYGGKYLVIDEVSGLLLAAIISRAGNSGSILALHSGENYSYDILRQLCLNAEAENITHLRISRIEKQPEEDITTESFNNKTEERKAAALLKIQKIQQCRAVLESGGFDCLMVASSLNPMDVLENLSKYLNPSRQVVFYSQYIATLLEAFQYMRNNADFLDVQISDTWMRKYQVLPQRTRPENSMSGSPGFILSGTFVGNSEPNFDKSAESK